MSWQLAATILAGGVVAFMALGMPVVLAFLAGRLRVVQDAPEVSRETAALEPVDVTPDADEVRRVVLDRFDMSLGAGLGKLAGRVFRIGHLGYFNDLTLAGTLSGVQMGLRLAGLLEQDAQRALQRLARAQQGGQLLGKTDQRRAIQLTAPEGIAQPLGTGGIDVQ